MRAKLGLGDPDGGDRDLVEDLLVLLHAQQVDFTSFFRTLSSALRGDAAPVRSLFGDPGAFDAWAVRWHAELSRDSRDALAAANAMDRVNPVYIARNHKVEEALAAATDDDLGPFRRLLDAVTHPFDERPGLESYSVPAPPSFGPYRTFCGT